MKILRSLFTLLLVISMVGIVQADEPCALEPSEAVMVIQVTPAWPAADYHVHATSASVSVYVCDGDSGIADVRLLLAAIEWSRPPRDLGQPLGDLIDIPGGPFRTDGVLAGWPVEEGFSDEYGLAANVEVTEGHALVILIDDWYKQEVLEGRDRLKIVLVRESDNGE